MMRTSGADITAWGTAVINRIALVKLGDDPTDGRHALWLDGKETGLTVHLNATHFHGRIAGQPPNHALKLEIVADDLRIARYA